MCSCNSTEFSSLPKTWTPSSSLNSTDWNPLPELLPKKEKYEYALNTCQSGGGPMYFDYRISDRNGVKEKYNVPCCSATPYVNISKTWSSQKPYTLN
jgi:hypothetical protein